MAHFARLDNNNLVIEVLVTPNHKPNEGYDWLVDRFGGTWVQTSYNTRAGKHSLGGTPLRKNFASIGFTYDPNRDAFIPPKPFPSWVLNEDTCIYDPPTPMPEDGKIYDWDEAAGSWVEIIVEE